MSTTTRKRARTAEKSEKESSTTVKGGTSNHSYSFRNKPSAVIQIPNNKDSSERLNTIGKANRAKQARRPRRIEKSIPPPPSKKGHRVELEVEEEVEEAEERTDAGEEREEEAETRGKEAEKEEATPDDSNSDYQDEDDGREAESERNVSSTTSRDATENEGHAHGLDGTEGSELAALDNKEVAENEKINCFLKQLRCGATAWDTIVELKNEQSEQIASYETEGFRWIDRACCHIKEVYRDGRLPAGNRRNKLIVALESAFSHVATMMKSDDSDTQLRLKHIRDFQGRGMYTMVDTITEAFVVIAKGALATEMDEADEIAPYLKAALALLTPIVEFCIDIAPVIARFGKSEKGVLQDGEVRSKRVATRYVDPLKKIQWSIKYKWEDIATVFGQRAYLAEQLQQRNQEDARRAKQQAMLQREHDRRRQVSGADAEHSLATSTTVNSVVSKQRPTSTTDATAKPSEWSKERDFRLLQLLEGNAHLPRKYQRPSLRPRLPDMEAQHVTRTDLSAVAQRYAICLTE
jgi:hypothetical protein